MKNKTSLVAGSGFKKWIAPQNVVIFLLGMMSLTGRAVVTNAPSEYVSSHAWVVQNILTTTNPPPFSFTYNSVASSKSNLFSSWVRLNTATNTLDANRQQYLLQWTNASDGLNVKCVAVEYSDFPAIEWTVFLTNAGPSDTPLIDSLQGLNTSFSRGSGPEFVLNGNQGEYASVNSFAPFQTTLGPSSVNNFSPYSNSGRSCDGPNAWPYYDVQMPGGGILLAIGWPGQWASSFARDGGSNLNIQAGQQSTHLILHSGESIRTPLIVMNFWQGNDLLRAQNLWRHWYLSHVIPLVSNQPPSTVWQVQGTEVSTVDGFIQAGIQPDILWRDSGWYPDNNGPYTGGNAWLNTGTWEVDTNLYPNGFLATSTAIAAEGVKFLLWFEPERIGDTNHSFLATNNLSWILPATPSTVGDILNEGNPGAFNWLTNHIQGLIVSNGIGWYREDMNGNGPLPAWQNNDAANRQGMTENLYIQGHLAYWDDLIAMNPGLRIDSCASGGRRNDLETMRRAVPLDRSDDKVIEDNQDHTWGSSSWLPFSGQGDSDYDNYNFRSYYLPSYGNGFNQVQQSYNEFRKISPIMLFGDYYPLTPYTQGLDQWIGWQFDRPATGEGFLQTFRRASNSVSSMTLQLHGLSPLQAYDVQDLDRGDLGWFTGNSLMTTGLNVPIATQPGSALVYYTNAFGVQFPLAFSPLNLTPLTLQFQSSAMAANGSVPAYSWDFGDGNASNSQNPRHSYSTFGRYLAQVTATDDLGNSTTSQVPVTVMGTNWHRMKISFSGYSGPEALTNFPALVVFGTNLTTNGFAYNQMASTNGWDLVFLNWDGTKTLNYEIEKWATNDLSYVWVQIPSLTNNTTIWAYWGDTNLASAPAPCTTNGSVWANNFRGVWHLPNGSTLSAADSTTNHVDGGVSNVTATAGQIDGAGAFNGSTSYINLGASPTVNPAALTYSAWVKPASLANAYSSIISKAENGGRVGTLLLKSNGKLACYVGAAGTVDYDGTGASTLSVNQWYYLTMTYDSVSGLRGYVNGALDGSVAEVGAIFTNATDSVWIGGHPTITGRYFNGAIDEARLSSVARSTNWIKAEWLNMASNSVFNTYSTVTSNNIFAPSDLTATAVSSSQINLAWTDNATNESGYLIERSTDEYNWAVIAGTAANATAYSDSNGLSPSTLYYYRLSATNATAMSAGVVTNALTLGRFYAWQYSSQINFTGYNKGETLTNFPALINIGTNMPGFAWLQFANNNGYELRFADSSGNEIPYERDRGTNLIWTNSTGIGQVWVQVPQLNSETIITAYWGNKSATNSILSYCTNGAVWSGGFGGVWHLPDGTTLNAKDSTANHNNGTITAATATAGEIGGAGSFNGSTATINVGSAASVNPSALTYSAWIKAGSLANAYSSVISKAENGRVGTLLLKSNGKLACYVSAATTVDYDGTGGTILSGGQWYYVTMTYDAATGLNGYVNGVLDGSVSAEGSATTGADAVWIGAHPTIGGRYFNGVIDEARISAVARDANWVWAEWINMASNSVFAGYGTVKPTFSTWQYRAQLTFSGYSKTGTLTNFPALVNIGTNIPGFAWSQFASANGYELRFTDASGNELSYERDRGTNIVWTNSIGMGQVWVLVPLLDSSTAITAYWGNSAATNSISAYCTNGAVWANGFGGVWHLPDGTVLNPADSTANRNGGVISNATATAGQIGGAGLFNGSRAYINVKTNPSVNPSALTYSAWVKPSALANAYSSVISKAENGRVGSLLIKSTGKLACFVQANTLVDYDGAGTGTLSAGQWYYLTMTYDSASGLVGYVNGAVDGTAAANGAVTTGADAVWIGAHPTIAGRYFNGVIDEARISTVARPANWVWAEWQNVASNNVFISYGSAGPNTPGFSAWNYYSRIAFTGYTRTETLTNFAALINIGTNIYGFAWSQFASTNGYELRFSDASGNELPYERDSRTNLVWTNSLGIGPVWVRVPALGSNTVIIAYWGNPNATNAIPAYCTNGAVWVGTYSNVWHLNELNAYDSALSIDGTNDSDATKISGVIGSGAAFTGTIASDIGFGIYNPLANGMGSVSAWTYFTTNAFGLDNYVMAKGDDNGPVSWGIDLLPQSSGTNSVYLLYGSAQWPVSGAFTANTNTWHLVTAVMGNNQQQIYVDGTLLGAGTAATITPTAGSGFFLGKTDRSSPFSYSLNGGLDDVHISSIAHSSNWVWAEWLNVASNNVFASYGDASGGHTQPLLAKIPTTFDEWRQAYFTADELADPSISGETATPNQDGVNNLLKYAFGLSPWSSDPSALPFVGEWVDPGTQLRYVTLNYQQNTLATDLIFAPKATDDISTNVWLIGLPEIGRQSDVGVDKVTVRDLVPMTSAAHRYLRLDVSRAVNE